MGRKAKLKKERKSSPKKVDNSGANSDEFGLSICLPNIKRFYQETQDDSILEAVASLLNKTVEEVREVFNNG